MKQVPPELSARL